MSNSGTDRRLVVEKRRPYTTLIGTVGAAAVGYLVADKEERRGFVQAFLPKREAGTKNEWLVVWDTTVNGRGGQRRKNSAASAATTQAVTTTIHEEEYVEIDKLNELARQRWDNDEGAGRAPADRDDEMEALDGDVAHPLLKEMLEGADEDWETGPWSQIKYDLFHHLGVWAKITSADKKSLLFKTFMIALADTYSKLLLGEMERIVAHCLRSGMSADRIGELRRKYVLK